MKGRPDLFVVILSVATIASAVTWGLAHPSSGPSEVPRTHRALPKHPLSNNVETLYYHPAPKPCPSPSTIFEDGRMIVVCSDGSYYQARLRDLP